MKLGELKGERAVEVIAELIEPIANLAIDFPNFRITKEDRKEGESDRDVTVRVFKEKIPLLLRTHKSDVLKILCTVNGSDPDELSVIDIIKGVIELTNDQDFLNLFLSAVNTGAPKPPTA